jgi:glucosamine--fructose-6-phosphate aminotransferase (isomerizing)
MCGIVGYIGTKDCVPLMVNALKRLEYRGYDSAGVAVIMNGGLEVRKRAGKVTELVQQLEARPVSGTVGIGHTRWATHGAPTDVNAHPHCDEHNRFALIHNGIVENYATIKQRLIKEGRTFKTQTDTEVLVQLIDVLYEKVHDFETAVRLGLKEVAGAYGIAVICREEPDKLIAARKGSPLAIGIGEDEFIVASDATAIVSHTRQVVYLDDGEIAVLTRTGFITKTIEDVPVTKEVEEITFDLEQLEKGGYPHFMLKEIHQQPETIRDAMRGRLLPNEGTARLGGLDAVKERLRNAKRIIFTACGTSWHAALVGEYMLEQFARIPVEVEYASEFRYRSPVVRDDDVVFVISQSGETADTLAALREAKRQGALGLGIVNVVGSSIARETEAGVYIHAGAEIGVASTKAFTSQLVALGLITLMVARMRNLSVLEGKRIVQALEELPTLATRILNNTGHIQEIAEQFKDARNVLYLGRGYNFPVALEGALKLKEISYIHAEGYPAAEMKHGPIALIDENMPVVVVVPTDDLRDKVISNIEEVRARGGRIIAVATEGDPQVASIAEHVITIPQTISMLTPILSVIPLHLLAYYIAVARGCNVDQPRNLAKSVTVE